MFPTEDKSTGTFLLVVKFFDNIPEAHSMNTSSPSIFRNIISDQQPQFRRLLSKSDRLCYIPEISHNRAIVNCIGFSATMDQKTFSQAELQKTQRKPRKGVSGFIAKRPAT